MYAVRVVLKSGTTVAFEAEEVRVPADEDTGTLTGFGWQNADDPAARRLVYVDPGDIAAVTVQQLPSADGLIAFPDGPPASR